jgi:hypothetical protein
MRLLFIRFPLLLLLILLIDFSSAGDSIEIQKTPSGEIWMKKESTPPPSPNKELKIEVISFSNPVPPEGPKIEVNPRPETPSSTSSPASNWIPLLQKLASEPIQITIKNGKAQIHWAGGEEEIPLDPQGRFNLQFLPNP